MPLVKSFAPLADRDARVLILGSMPGEASLRAEEYYAHPRNAFWPIMGQLFGFDSSAPYAQRVRDLLGARVAVWDVLASCHREGSLDSEIDDASSTVNDFVEFLQTHPDVRTVCFNGAKAESTFRKCVLPHLSGLGLTFHRLPSTSPANASLSFEKKHLAWAVILASLAIKS